MGSEFVIRIAGEAVYTVLKASAPMLIIGLDRWSHHKYFSSNDSDSRTNLSLCSENCCGSAVHFNIWTLDYEYTWLTLPLILLNNLYKFVG